MSDISLPYRPRSQEDPLAADVVQANLDYLVTMFQKGVAAGDLLQWDPVLGRFVAGPATDATPVGSGKVWFVDTAPPKWLVCNGAAVSRTVYSALFAVLGTTWGVGDGSTTFNLPDLRGRVPVGVNPTGPALINGIAKTDGRTLANRSVSHYHEYDRGTNVGDAQGGAGGVLPLQTHTVTKSSGDANNKDHPSFATVNWIVYAGV